MYRPQQPRNENLLEDRMSTSIVAGLLSATKGTASQKAPSPPQDLVAELVHKLLALQQENDLLKQQVQQQQQPHAPLQQLQQKQLQPQPQPQPTDAAVEQQLHHQQLELQRLRQQCSAAWQQVADLKAFLNDYGLVWVGPPAADCTAAAAGAQALAGSATSGASDRAQPQQAAGSSTLLPFDLAELQECLDELNLVAGAAGGTLQHAAAGDSSSSSPIRAVHLHAPADAVALQIFSDGLQLHTAPARPYSDATADAILTDLFDLYFPSVLRHEFPDGVAIQLVDRSSSNIADAVAAAAATASNGRGNIRGFDDVSRQRPAAVAALDGQALINRLPKSVIRNGHVTPVRGVVQDFNGSSSSSSSGGGGTGKVYVKGSSRRGSNSDGGAAATTQLATLQVKSEDGRQTYVLKLPFSATIAALRSSIDAHRAASSYVCAVCRQAPGTAATTTSAAAGGAACCSYELRTAFPAHAVHADGSLTLEQAGLTPSATLFMKHR